jgi:hypothetical protein
MNKLQVDIKTLFELKLNFDSYLVLYCLYKKNTDLLIKYVRECGSIPTETFKQLKEKGYILMEDENADNIYISNISLTIKSRELLGNKQIGAEDSFDEFRTHYPKIYKVGSKVKRRLQGNIPKCRELYKELLKEVSHETLCKCADLYKAEQISSNGGEFCQMLETWLRQRTYEQYLDDLNKDPKEGGFVDVI